MHRRRSVSDYPYKLSIFTHLRCYGNRLRLIVVIVVVIMAIVEVIVVIVALYLHLITNINRQMMKTDPFYRYIYQPLSFYD